MRALRSPLCLLVLLCAALLGAAFETADSVVDPDVKPPSFNKAELEELLKKEHSDKISNIYDSDNDIQYTWNVEEQILCPGVDGHCSKEEL